MGEFVNIVKELGAVGVLAFLAIYVVVRLEPTLAKNKQVTELNILATEQLTELLKKMNGKK